MKESFTYKFLYSWALTLRLWPFLHTSVSVILPVVKALRSYVVTSEGSNVTLTRIGRRVKALDTMVKWKFEGQEIEESSNKIAIVKFLNKDEKIFRYI